MKKKPAKQKKTKTLKNKHAGSSFDSYLKKEASNLNAELLESLRKSAEEALEFKGYEALQVHKMKLAIDEQYPEDEQETYEEFQQNQDLALKHIEEHKKLLPKTVEELEKGVLYSWPEDSIPAPKELKDNVQKIRESGGLKFDGEKAPLDLIPYESLEEVAKVLKHGMVKYERANWAKGINYSRLIAAAMRHLGQFNNGLDLDEESSLSHVSHAATNLVFLMWMIKNRPDLDDRWAKDVKTK